MCQICDGLTLEEVLAGYAADVTERGFVLIGVEENDEHPALAYSVGLLDTANHPEFVLAGVPIETCLSLLPALAMSVVAGERYEIGETVGFGGKGAARVGAVNEIQYELETFSTWHNMQRSGTIRTPRLKALQILMPPTFFASCDRDPQPRLDDPRARVDVRLSRPRPNRAERRRYRPRR